MCAAASALSLNVVALGLCRLFFGRLDKPAACFVVLDVHKLAWRRVLRTRSAGCQAGVVWILAYGQFVHGLLPHCIVVFPLSFANSNRGVHGIHGR